MVLVVDEADKAPTHVTCILKNIIEGSEITLADGRRIIHKSKLISCIFIIIQLCYLVYNLGIHNMKSSSHILVHPNFRMIVLANRPGFPFLGNDFFASLGMCTICQPSLIPRPSLLPFFQPDCDKNKNRDKKMNYWGRGYVMSYLHTLET